MNYLKVNLMRLINKVSIENHLTIEGAFIAISAGNNGFLWDLYDYIERKYGIERDKYNSSSLDVKGFMNSLHRLTETDVEIITSGMNEHTSFEFMLYYTVENVELL